MNLLMTQVGGTHYLSAYQTIEYGCNHDFNGFQLNSLKYPVRHGKKNGLEDVEKAINYCALGKHLNPKNHATYEQRDAERFVTANALESDFDHYLYYLTYQDWDACVSYLKRMAKECYGVDLFLEEEK